MEATHTIPTGRPGRSIRLLAAAVLLIGAGLRVWQFQANPALWLDEVAIARNVVDRPVHDLMTEPLAYQQAAPKGFLLVEKLATFTLGPTDRALRLFPFICSLAGLIGFWLLTRRIFDPFDGLVALTLFSFSAPLLRYSSQVKQYSADVAVAVLLLWLALLAPKHFESRRRALWIGAIGAAAVWFSQPAVFVVTAVCAITAWRLLESDSASRRHARCLAPVVALWCVSAIVATIVGLASTTPTTRAYMQQYWQAGFVPLSITQELELLWPWDQLRQLFGQGALGAPAAMAYPMPSVYVALAIFGLGVLAWRGWVGRIILGPVLVALAAAIVHQYPFSDRLLLFLIPNFFLGIAASVSFIQSRIGSLAAGWPYAVALMVLVPAIYPVANVLPPYGTEDVKPVLAHLQSSRQHGDAVYVYYGGAPAVEFYAAQYGLRANTYAIGGCYRGEGRRYLEELDRYRGRARLWVIVAHAAPVYRERDDILGYLDAIGLRRDWFLVRPRTVVGQGLPAEAFLYDLSDAAKLLNASAASFKLQGPSSRLAKLGCVEGPQSMSVARTQEFE